MPRCQQAGHQLKLPIPCRRLERAAVTRSDLAHAAQAEAVRALVRLGGAEQPVRLFLPLARVGVDHAQHQQPLLRAGAHGDVPVRVVQRVAKQRAQVRVGDRQFFRQEDADIRLQSRLADLARLGG